MNLKNKVVLVTGGTGSFGQSFINKILNQKDGPKKVIVFSRDELKQYEMQKRFKKGNLKKLRFFLGDVRDSDRVRSAFSSGVDIVVHAAALKQVPAAEYNPFEFIKTNILGAQNIIENSILYNVKKVIALSTDKAAAPINLYGATKLCSDKLFISANKIKGNKKISFSVVRYGNVMGSRGSVVPFFLKNKNKILEITDKNMTRFSISLSEGVNTVLYAIKMSLGSEIFVPKIPSYLITDLAKAINRKYKYKIIGIRQGEKIHEEMMTSSDSISAIENNKYYIILPSNQFDKSVIKKYENQFGAKKLKKFFSYNSKNNSNFLTVEQLEQEIKKTQNLI